MCTQKYIFLAGIPLRLTKCFLLRESQVVYIWQENPTGSTMVEEKFEKDIIRLS